MKPILHMGLGWDDFHLRALTGAGFDTCDLVLIARTGANRAWARRNAPRATVVDLPYAQALKTNPVIGSTVRPALRRAGDGAGLDPWDLILGERSLRRRPADVAISFANKTAEVLSQVVDGPTIAIAEFTVTSEIILSGLVAQAGGLPFWPRTLRHPSDRFALFSTPRGIRHVARAHPDEIDPVEAGELLEDVVLERKRPSYYARNAKAEGPAELWRLASDRVREFSTDRGHNLQLPTVRDYAKLPWLNVLRGRGNARRYRKRCWDQVPDRPYVVFPLHVQPESTVDMMAPEWRDQAASAVAIASALEAHGIALVVKEHSNFIWRRDPSFWAEIDAHPNIAAVDPTSDNAALMAGAEWVFTPTGTAGLEAALRGTRVVMGASMSWTALPNVAYVASPAAMVGFVEAAGWQDLVANRSRAESWWREEYLANSFPGVSLDPPRFPAVMEPDNLRHFAAAYAEAVEIVESGRAVAALHPES